MEKIYIYYQYCVGFGGNISKIEIALLITLLIGSTGTTFAAERVTIIGSTTVLPLGEAIAEEFNTQQQDCQVTVAGGGTGAGITAIVECRSNIAMASRELTSDEKTKHGDKFKEFHVGDDGIVIAVSKLLYDAGIRELTVDQVKKIYAGEINNWKDLGGPDMQICAIAREQSSGTRDAFNEDIIGDKKVETPGVCITAMGNAEVKTAIVDADNAIGYLGFSYAFGGNIEPVSLDGVMPSVESIKDGSYKLHRHLYFYTFGDPTPCAGKFINFVTSPEGQIVAEEMGFIPL